MNYLKVFKNLKFNHRKITDLHQFKRLSSTLTPQKSDAPEKNIILAMKNWNNNEEVHKSIEKYGKLFNEPFLTSQENASQAARRMLIAFQHWYQVPQGKLDQVSDVMQHFQDVLTFYDDIIDGSEVRRGRPTPHIQFGLEHASNCAVFNFFKAQERAFELTNYDSEVMKAWNAYATSLYRSEGYDKAWMQNNYCPSLEEYGLNMIYKVGWSAFLCTKMLEPFSKVKHDTKKFSEVFGAYYQFCDDYENYFMPESFFEGKEKFADDLTEGKYTLPTIHAIRIMGNEEIAEMIRKRPADIESKRLFVEKMEEIGTKEFCKGVLKQLDQDVRAEADQIGPNPILEKVLDRIKDWERN